MDLKEMSLKCFECGNPYTFSVEDQQTFQAKGRLHPPKRCPECRAVRAAKKTERPAEKFSAPSPIRQMFEVTCTVCGKQTQVPFEPRAGRPVYCSDCYHKLRTSK